MLHLIAPGPQAEPTGDRSRASVVWLASYPKSGNTWMRLLVANLSATDGPVDINDLPERGGMASAREPLDQALLIESAVLTHEECDRLRPIFYVQRADGEEMDEEEKAGPIAAERVRFVKTHDAYTCTVDGEPLLGGSRAAAGAVLIVRDPRDVAASLANHNDSTIDEAIAFMSDADAAFCARPHRQHNQLRQQLPGWSGYTASWLEQRDIPLLVVRYEDMQADTAGSLRRVLAFSGRDATDERIEQAVRFAAFATVQQQEREKGFREAPRPHAGGNFFRRGVAGGWRDELTAEQAARIEDAHGPVMRRLGYST